MNLKDKKRRKWRLRYNKFKEQILILGRYTIKIAYTSLIVLIICQLILI